MARNAAFVVALLCTLAFGLAADAQALQRLHVRSMVASAEPQRLRLGDMLRFVLRVRVDERVGRLDNVTLPDLSGFDVLGDERRCVPVRAGTDCTETLSLAPTVAGTRTIGPITLDAVDARSGRPMRFGSNPIRVFVSASAPGVEPGTLARAASQTFRIVGIVFLAAIAALALVLGFRRTKRAQAPVPAPQPRKAELPRDEDGRFRTAIDHLRARPSRGRVDTVRAILRERIGADSGETFADLAARGAQFEEPSAMEALRLVERAAFIDDEHLASAVTDALPALESIAGMKRVSG